MWAGVFFRRNKKHGGGVFDLPDTDILAIIVFNIYAERPSTMVDQQPFADFDFINISTLEYYLAPSGANTRILHVVVKKNDTSLGRS